MGQKFETQKKTDELVVLYVLYVLQVVKSKTSTLW